VLNVVAPTINQYGTLRAPLGTINLGPPAPAQPSIIAPGSGGDSNGIGNWTFYGITTQNFAVGQSVALTGTDGTDGTATLNGLIIAYNSGQQTMTVAVTSANGLIPKYQNLGDVNWTITVANQQTPTAITLGKGSLTSVSANGLIIPYGYTTNAASISTNTTWSYNTDPSDPLVAQTITAPPAKLITINAGKVTVASGATIDESGGGNLYAGEFVPGTGGSLNIFAGQNKNIAASANVYAVMPGYTSSVTPYDPAISTGGPSIGQQVYLGGIPGLPAGTYTLLPSQYAQLPGAFLVTLQTAPAASTVATTRTPIPATTLADGSALTSGYFISSGSSATDQHWSVFKVMSGAVARQYSQIVDSYANTFFPQLAAVNGTGVPRLPRDAGQLSITANSSLTFQGTGAFAPAAGGLGGVADISGNQILVVDNEAAVAAIAAGTNPVANYAPGLSTIGGTTDPDGWAPLVLAATDLNKLGVESLLIGGSRSFQSDGVHITPTANTVVIANDATSPLSLPEVQVIAGPALQSNPITIDYNQTTIASAKPGTGQVIIAPNAVIQASGTVAGGGESNIILPQATPLNSGASAAAIQAHYLAVAEDQVGYVRVSNGNLSTLNVNPNFAGLPSGAGLPTNYPTNNGSLTIGAGAQLISNNSILLYANNTGTMAAGVKLTTNTLEVRSGTTISLGTDSASSGIVLDQSDLTAIGGVRNLRDRHLRQSQPWHPRSDHRTADTGYPHSRRRRACRKGDLRDRDIHGRAGNVAEQPRRHSFPAAAERPSGRHAGDQCRGRAGRRSDRRGDRPQQRADLAWRRCHDAGGLRQRQSQERRPDSRHRRWRRADGGIAADA
jgi:hypothetical protein